MAVHASNKHTQEISIAGARRPDLVLINKKQRTCKLVDFALPADHRVKMKENEKMDKYLDLARELKKLWNMNVKVILIVVGALGTVPKSLEKIGKSGNQRKN